MKKQTLLLLALIVLLSQSCATKRKMLYLQDLDKYSDVDVNYVEANIQVNDILKVDISDLNPSVAAPFNLATASSGSIAANAAGYLVNNEGKITLPVLNDIIVSGFSPRMVEAKIKERLVTEGYLVNPTVIVRVVNNKFTILGEVKIPGVISFTEESISLLNAIGLAGDLTYAAVRKDVKLIRESNGKRVVYHIDLTTASWMSNPDYRVRQNDVIVVSPNKLQVNRTGLLTDPLQILGLLTSLSILFVLFK